ncbi:hypothetical protein BLD48_10670 [Exiguobacterium sp. KRL4]|uniref:HEAT repeat domain-containing protein n=1 Tax=Exiguobacterium sp. KRL4 TaxID=1914536 RepID=UPI0008F7FDBA|nr:HEAT repeat domain-containing protein [Exiguobacterium sp. KRL4]OIN66438.1 hypothetical protein BLD48_10670 [Exiguobacterium sp. KRL4]
MRWIIFFIVLLIALQVGALVYLVVQKRKRVKEEDARLAWQRQFQDQLYDFATGEQTEMPRILPGNEDLVELELFALTNLTATLSHQERMSQYVEAKLLPYYQKQIQHRRIDRRLNAYEAIAQFRLRPVAQELHQKLNKKLAKEEKDVIVRTLVSIAPNVAIEEAKQTNEISFFGAVLAVGRSKDLSLWVKDFDSLTESFQMAILQLIYDRDETQYVELARRKTTDANPEIRKRALRALTRIGLEEDWQLYTPYLEEETSWVEQMLALRFLENVAPKEALIYILPFVGSRSWWVRTAAFDALLACGGLEQLALVAKDHPDRYAKQKATERLAKEMKQHVVI